MADSDSIMQLGVAAARDGNRDEARNLFRLLTRQEPDNAQAWLWLAGVADGRDERQAALERVIALEPDNEMAVKGLAALGVDVESHRATVAAPHMAPETPVVPPTPEPAVSMRDRYDIDDDDPYAALDTLSDAMNDSPEAVRRTSPRADDDAYGSLDDMSDAMAGSSAVRRSGDTPRSSSATQRTAYSSSSSRRSSRLSDEDEDLPQRRTNPLLLAVLLLLLLVLGAWVLNALGLFGNFFGGTPVAVQPTSDVVVPAGDATTVGAPTDAVPATGTDPNAPVATADPNAPVVTADPNAPVATADPNAPVATADPNAPVATEPNPQTAPAQPQAPAALPSLESLANAAPAPVPAGTTLESAGWAYNFTNVAYANNIFGPIGTLAPAQGRFVVVLLTVGNTSGSPRTIAAEQFVLKDAQGRIHAARPDASAAYVNTFGRGVAADLSMEDEIPADGVQRSVALLFDVPQDATGLVLFSSTNPDQGFQVLQ